MAFERDDRIFAARRRIAAGGGKDARRAKLPAARDQDQQAGDHAEGPENCRTLRAIRPSCPLPFRGEDMKGWRAAPSRSWRGGCGSPGPSSSASRANFRSEEQTSELKSLMRNLYAVFCVKQKRAQDYKDSQKQKNIVRNI